MRKTRQFVPGLLLEPPSIYIWPVILVCLTGVLLWLMVPRPPNQITLAAGSPDGLYFRFGEALAKELAKEQISLRVLPTAGSLDNLRRLNEPGAGVHLALVQGGVGTAQQWPKVQALASVFNEKLWVFYRPAAFSRPPEKLGALQGKAVSLGLPGSGTRELTERLFALNGLKISGAGASVRVQDLDAGQSLAALKNNKIDAALLVLAPDAPVLKEYFQAPGLSVMGFEQAEAYALRLPFLQAQTMPLGAIDLQRNIPESALKLLSAPAALVVHEEIHPALITPIMRATQSAIASLALLEKPGEFPSAKGFDWPHHDDAAHYLSTGPSFLHRHLPFWGAVWVERAIRIALPLLVLLLPMLRLLPVLIRYRVDSKTGEIYRRLNALERECAHNPSTDWRPELDAVYAKALKIRVPKRYMSDVYELRMHIDLIRQKMERQQ